MADDQVAVIWFLPRSPKYGRQMNNAAAFCDESNDISMVPVLITTVGTSNYNLHELFAAKKTQQSNVSNENGDLGEVVKLASAVYRDSLE